MSRYTYNGDGWRLSQTTSGVTTDYRYVPISGLPHVLAERRGGQTSRYVYGRAVLLQDDPANGRSFYASDAAGQIVTAYRYDAFGAVRSQSGTVPNALLFVGQHRDDTGLYFLRARYYDPSLGRFLSRDPRPGDPDQPATLHAYIYAANNPLGAADIGGESFEQWSSVAKGTWAETAQQTQALGQIIWGSADREPDDGRSLRLHSAGFRLGRPLAASTQRRAAPGRSGRPATRHA